MQDNILKVETQNIASLLKQKNLTISIVESCTGGLIQKLITDVPGSSKYFLGGVVAYSNQMKEKIVGVKSETLRKYGAVSQKTALELAHGIRKITGSDIGLSTTGIAGPTGGTKEKPVGLVYIGVSCRGTMHRAPTSTVKRFLFKGTRQQIRRFTAIKALQLLESILYKTT